MGHHIDKLAALCGNHMKQNGTSLRSNTSSPPMIVGPCMPKGMLDESCAQRLLAWCQVRHTCHLSGWWRWILWPPWYTVGPWRTAEKDFSCQLQSSPVSKLAKADTLTIWSIYIYIYEYVSYNLLTFFLSPSPSSDRSQKSSPIMKMQKSPFPWVEFLEQKRTTQFLV